jgi:hypothetical protein
MAWCMSTISTVTYRDPSSTSRVPELKVFRFFQHLRDMPFWYGLKTLMTPQVKATTENTTYSILEFTKANRDHSFLSLTTKSKM